MILNALRKHWAVTLVFLFSLLTIIPLLHSGYFSHHDDLQVIRIFEMRKCLTDFQIPCRWVTDMGNGYGFPLFNFYSVFPYYLGAVLSTALGFIVSAKILFAIPLLLSGVAMYLLSKEFFGTYGAILSGILYTFVPYRALDTYVRGAMAESFALLAYPLILYFSFRLISKSSLGSFLGFVFSLAVLFTTHNISTLIFVPVLVAWVGYWLYIFKFNNLAKVIVAGAIALAISAFFILPAYMEKDLVQTESLYSTDLDYKIHFASWSQLFINRNWGYGASINGPNDTISFQIGWPHWWLVVLVFAVALVKFRKIPKRILGLLLFSILVFGIAIFMTHNKSTFIWSHADLLKYVQFPWRFLGIAAVFSSLLGGSFVYFMSGKFLKLSFLILCFITIFLNAPYFAPEKYTEVTDEQKLSDGMWDEQIRGGILDYLPKSAREPKVKADGAKVIAGLAYIYSFEKKSNGFELVVNSKGNALIGIPVFDFAGWTIKGAKSYSTDKNGLIQIEVDGSNKNIIGEFTDTPIRSTSNLISILGVVGLIGFLFYAKGRKNFWQD